MNIRHLKYCIVVAEEKNFTNAAKRLFISQPSLSECITKLEKQLDVKLFDRSTNPISLTYAGEIFIENAKQILQSIDQLTNQMADISNNRKGHLTIGASPYYCKYILPSILQIHKQRFPNIEIVLLEKPYVDSEVLLRKGEIDIIITALPTVEKTFDFIPLCTERIFLALPPDYPVHNLPIRNKSINNNLTKKTIPRYPFPSVPLSHFKDSSFVLLEPNQRFHQYIISICRQVGFKPNIVLSGRSHETIISMVLANIGISFVPEIIVKYGNLLQCPLLFSLTDIFPTRNTIAIYRKDLCLSKIAHDFISTAKEFLSESEINN